MLTSRLRHGATEQFCLLANIHANSGLGTAINSKDIVFDWMQLYTLSSSPSIFINRIKKLLSAVATETFPLAANFQLKVWELAFGNADAA
jgi:hypothetical protein